MKFDLVFAAARRACPGPLWNQGTALARSAKVTLVEQDDEMSLVQVQTPRKGAIAVRVYPDDEEWDCDCPSQAPACEHVAAAVIALRQETQADGVSLARAQERGRIAYVFEPCPPTLSLQRCIEQDGARRDLDLSIKAAIRSPRASFVVTEADRRADAILTSPKRGALPDAQLKALFSVLGEALTYLGERRIELRTQVILPHATLRDHPKQDGFVLRILADPRVDEVVGAGLVRCGDALHFLGELKLCGLHMERLPLAKHFAAQAVPSLVAKTLPALQKRIRVEIQTQQLPETTRALRPQLRFRIHRRGDTLDVTPQIVYGEPPVAKVVQRELVRIRGALPKRDEAGEVALVMQLRDRYLMVPEKPVYLHGEVASRFVDNLQGFEGTIEGFDPRARDRRPLHVEIGAQRDGVTVQFWTPLVDGARSEIPAQRVLQAWRNGENHLMTPQGGVRLDLDWLDAHGSALQSLLDESGPDPASTRTTRALTELSGAQSLALLRMLEGLHQPPPAALEPLKQKIEDFSQIETAPLPEGFTATLRPYQQQGVDWLVFLRGLGMGALLADDMGLGKTVQTLAALHGRALVVCPTSVLFNWRREAERFLPGRRICVFHGPARALDPQADLTLTSYALLRQDARLREVHWDHVVLDEAQAIKNPQSQTSQAAFSLQCRARIALSGTPVENRLDELWSLMHFCNPGLLGGRKEFAQRVAEPVTRGDPRSAELLAAKLRPVMLRRTKAEVARDLPPRTEDTLYCELDPEERALYESLRRRTRTELQATLQANKPSNFSVLEKLLRLRQAACHRGLLPGQTAEDSSKIRRLLDALESVCGGGHRALVFSQWTTMLDAVAPHLDAAQIRWSRIDGSTRDRGRVVEDFSNPDGPQVMLISLKAGGTGLNLTAADHVFLLDPWWNPAAEAQAADRAHRIGQQKPVLVYRLVAKDTVEEKIMALQAQKRAVAEQAMAGALVDAGLSAADLRALLD